MRSQGQLVPIPGLLTKYGSTAKPAELLKQPGQPWAPKAGQNRDCLDFPVSNHLALPSGLVGREWVQEQVVPFGSDFSMNRSLLEWIGPSFAASQQNPVLTFLIMLVPWSCNVQSNLKFWNYRLQPWTRCIASFHKFPHFTLSAFGISFKLSFSCAIRQGFQRALWRFQFRILDAHLTLPAAARSPPGSVRQGCSRRWPREPIDPATPLHLLVRS